MRNGAVGARVHAMTEVGNRNNTVALVEVAPHIVSANHVVIVEIIRVAARPAGLCPFPKSRVPRAWPRAAYVTGRYRDRVYNWYPPLVLCILPFPSRDRPPHAQPQPPP